MPQDAAKLTTTLNKNKVPELKKMLEDRGLSTNGTKPILIGRLVEAMVQEDSVGKEVKGDEENDQESASSTSTEDSTKDESEKEPSKRDNKQPSPTKEKSPPPAKERSPSPAPKERSPSPAPKKRSPSPAKERTPSPAREKERSPSKSPAKRARSPSPRKDEEAREETREETKEKRKETSSNNGAKRQRKWETKAQNDISISSDTLDRITDSLPQQSHTVVHRQEPRVVVRQEKAVEDESGERVVPPARKPESRTLFVDRFVRPFLAKHAKEMLEKFGETEYFWMNNIRSHCYVTYKTIEQAKAAREGIYNLVWPPANKSRLIAEFSTESEALRRAEVAKARETPQQPQPVQTAQPTTPAPQAGLSRSGEHNARTSDRDNNRDRETGRDRDRDRTDTRRDDRTDSRRDDRERGRGERDRIDNRREERERRQPPPPPPKVTLESLFKKTEARPSIYWLPLTDKEVEDKKAASTTTTAKA